MFNIKGPSTKSKKQNDDDFEFEEVVENNKVSGGIPDIFDNSKSTNQKGKGTNTSNPIDIFDFSSSTNPTTSSTLKSQNNIDIFDFSKSQNTSTSTNITDIFSTTNNTQSQSQTKPLNTIDLFSRNFLI